MMKSIINNICPIIYFTFVLYVLQIKTLNCINAQNLNNNNNHNNQYNNQHHNNLRRDLFNFGTFLNIDNKKDIQNEQENDNNTTITIIKSDNNNNKVKLKNIGIDEVYLRNINYYNNICPVDITSEPECILSFNIKGSWICRTLYNIVTGESNTFSACVDTKHFIKTDTCGCCNNLCPDPCLCKCDLYNSNDQKGVLVQNVNYNDDDNENDINDNITDPNTRCVDPYRAYRLITGPGFRRQPSCSTECI